MSSPSGARPPQPCDTVMWFLTAVVAFSEIALLWMVVGEAVRWRKPNPFTLLIWAVGSAGLGWLYLRVLTYHRLRLGENGLWPNRRGYPNFVPWAGARLTIRGLLIVVQNGPLSAEIHLASFCRIRPVLEFLHGRLRATSS